MISAAGKDGFVFKDGTEYGCLGQLIISILSMDYDEVWVTFYPISLPAVDPISGKGLPQSLGLILNFHAPYAWCQKNTSVIFWEKSGP